MFTAYDIYDGSEWFCLRLGPTLWPPSRFILICPGAATRRARPGSYDGRYHQPQRFFRRLEDLEARGW